MKACVSKSTCRFMLAGIHPRRHLQQLLPGPLLPGQPQSTARAIVFTRTPEGHSEQCFLHSGTKGTCCLPLCCVCLQPCACLDVKWARFTHCTRGTSGVTVRPGRRALGPDQAVGRHWKELGLFPFLLAQHSEMSKALSLVCKDCGAQLRSVQVRISCITCYNCARAI